MPKKEGMWKFDEVEAFLIVILLVVISKYWVIYLQQNVSVKFSWCENKKIISFLEPQFSKHNTGN